MTEPLTRTYTDRSLVLLLLLCGLFVGFYVTGDIIGSKLFTFTIFGLTPKSFGLSSEDGPFIATVGTLAFPLTFILTDIVNEYFGRYIVRRFTFVAIAVLLILQPVLVAGVNAPTISFTPGTTSEQMDQAVRIVLGPAWPIVVGSVLAFAVGQLLDVWIFGLLRRVTGGRMLWLRSQGSTVVSQLIDSFVVIFVAFVIYPHLFGDPKQAWSVSGATNVSTTNYLVKFIIAVAITPVIYAVHYAVHAWLGHEEAERLVAHAHPTGA